MASTLVDRIELGILAKGLSAAALGRMAGIKHANWLSQIKSGSMTGRKLMPALASALECDLVWLNTGRGPSPIWAATGGNPHDPNAIGFFVPGIFGRHFIGYMDRERAKKYARRFDSGELLSVFVVKLPPKEDGVRNVVVQVNGQEDTMRRSAIRAPAADSCDVAR